MQGILLVNKPAGWTSFDVVNYVRKQVATAEGKKPKSIKVGHAGTLDPFATGLLVLLIGKDYTRRAAEFSKLDKIYEVTARLGETSSTGDPEGKTTPVNDNEPTTDEIKQVLSRFTGNIQQTPPIYSAIKVNGQRAYKLARKGEKVELKPRQVTVNQLELRAYNYPEVKFTASVSSGTYIRSLVGDIGQALGTGAYTKELKRTEVGNFSLDRAQTTEQLNLDKLVVYL